jgi:hypothetical protein
MATWEAQGWLSLDPTYLFVAECGECYKKFWYPSTLAELQRQEKVGMKANEYMRK